MSRADRATARVAAALVDDRNHPTPATQSRRRCPTRIAVAARKLGHIRADVAVALSLSLTHKAVGSDRTIPNIDVDTLDHEPTGTVPVGVPGASRYDDARNRQQPRASILGPARRQATRSDRLGDHSPRGVLGRAAAAGQHYLPARRDIGALSPYERSGVTRLAARSALPHNPPTQPSPRTSLKCRRGTISRQ
jgi:hypothetical protein